MNRVYDRLTIQGEGPYAGTRCTFVRLYGCNLHCVWCDSAETWDIRGRNGIAYPAADNFEPLDPFEIVERVLPLDVDMVVVTGGEPLLQRDGLVVLAALLGSRGIATHIETNGTLSPGALADVVEHFVVSPKLASAQAGVRVHESVLLEFVEMGWRRASFKFVVADVDEVAEAAAWLDHLGVERRARWVMPEGITAARVAERMADIVEPALAWGFNVSGRQHVMLWGDERGR